MRGTNASTSVVQRRTSTVLGLGAFCIALALALLAMCLLCFAYLGDAPVFPWDEARHGISAYEMAMTGDPIVTTYRYETDMWNLKPPLSEWLQVVSYRLLGYTPLAMRLPSALCMMATCMVCLVFCWRRHGRLPGLAALVSLLSAGCLWTLHCARTGDADALFVMLCTLSTVCLCVADRSPRALMGSCLCFALAFLAKSFHAVVIGIELVAYIVLCRRSLRITAPLVVACIACAALPIVCWAGVRVIRDGTQFLEQMVLYDVLNRSANAIEEHAGGPAYYVAFLLGEVGVVASWVVLACGMAVGLAVGAGDDGTRKGWPHPAPEDVALWLAFLVPLVLFSMAKSKLYWYVYPSLPALALLVGKHSQPLFDRLGQRAVLVLVVPLLACAISLRRTAAVILHPDASDFQAALWSVLDREGSPAGKKLYLDVTDARSEGWSQEDVLVAELAGDMRCADGTRADWASDADALIVTMTNRVPEQGSVVASKGDYVLVAHG